MAIILDNLTEQIAILILLIFALPFFPSLSIIFYPFFSQSQRWLSHDTNFVFDLLGPRVLKVSNFLGSSRGLLPPVFSSTGGRTAACVSLNSSLVPPFWFLRLKFCKKTAAVFVVGEGLRSVSTETCAFSRDQRQMHTSLSWLADISKSYFFGHYWNRIKIKSDIVCESWSKKCSDAQQASQMWR